MEIRELLDVGEIRALEPLFREYYTLVTERLYAATGIRVPVDVPVGTTMNNLETYLPPKGHTFVCEADGVTLGMIVLKWLDAEAMEVKRLYLLPQTRGTGLGRRLVRMIEDVARADGARALRLDSLVVLSEAIALYESEGYTYRDVYPGSEIAEIDGIRDHCIFMEKRL
jgi:GNAT superfamily N-acetyltransferase